MATEVKFPDALLASTNLSGAVTEIDEDPDSPDGLWLTATSATTATSARVSFPTSSGVPNGAQNFRALFRKTSGTPDPTVSCQLYQNGVARATLLTNQAISSTTGTVLQGNWNSSDLSGTLDGSDVEFAFTSVVGSSAASPGALPAYNSQGTETHIATLPGTNTINVPTHNSGDLLVLSVLCRNTNNDGALASINTAGWTQGGGAGTAYGGAVNARMSFGWKIGNGTETGVSITTTGGTSTDRLVAIVYRFTAANGFDATNPVENIGTATSGASTATMSMPTVTPGGTTQNKLAVCLFGISFTSSAASATGETGGDWVATGTIATGTNGAIGLQTANLSTGSTISGGTTTITSGSAYTAIGFTLKPASTPGSAVNTVEFGAVEWNVTYTPSGVTLTSSADVAIAASPTVSGSADSAVLTSRSVASNFDAVSLSTISGTTSLDVSPLATLQAQTTASSAVESTITAALPADSAISTLGGCGTTADSTVSQVTSVITSANLAVETSFTGISSLDGIASLVGTVSTLAESGVLGTLSASTDFDAVTALPSPTVVTTAETLVETTIQASTEADVASAITPLITSDADLGLAATYSSATQTDIAIAAETTAQTELDIFVFKDSEIITTTGDLAVEISSLNISAIADVITYAESSVNIVADVAVYTDFAVTTNTDSVIESPLYVLTNAETLGEDTLNVTTDLDVKVVTELVGITTPQKRASVQAYSGGAATIVARLDPSPTLSNFDRAQVTEIYRGVAPTAPTANIVAHIDFAAQTLRLISTSLNVAAQQRHEIATDSEAAVLVERQIASSADALLESSFSALVQGDLVSSLVAKASVTAEVISEIHDLTVLIQADVIAGGGFLGVDTLSDAAVQNTQQAFTSADIQVAGEQAVSTLSDFVAQKEFSISTTAEALVEGTAQNSTSLDTALSVQGAVAAIGQVAVETTISVETSVDSAAQLPESITSLSLLGAALVEKTLTTSTTSETIVEGTLLASVNADANLIEQVAGQVFATADGTVETTLNVSTVADAALSTSLTASTDADTNIINQIAGQVACSIDAVIEAAVSASTNADFAVGLLGQSQASNDAAISAVLSAQPTLDAAVMAAGEALAANADIAAETTRDASASLETAVQTDRSITALFEASAAFANSLSSFADFAAARVGAIALPSDAAIETTRILQTGLDLLIQTSGLLVIVEGAVEVTNSLAASVDVVAAKIGLATTVIESAVQNIINTSVIAEVAAQRDGLSISAFLDIGVASPYEITLSALDAVIELSSSLSCDLSAIVEVPNVLADLYADIIVAYNGLQTAEYDLVALKSLDVAAGFDAALELQDSIIVISFDTLVYNYNPFLPAPTGGFSVTSISEDRGISAAIENRSISGAYVNRSVTTTRAGSRSISGSAENRTVGG